MDAYEFYNENYKRHHFDSMFFIIRSGWEERE
jgi:hypothetical protein